MRNIKSKLPLLIILGLMLTGWLISSCNKGNDVTSINTFLTDRGLWRLASLRTETLNGDTTVKRDTLNTNCRFNQTFTFNADGTCTYEYFSCRDQVTQGNWELSSITSPNDNNLVDSVILRSGMVCKDTTAAGTGRPFTKARVINLGQNSLVLEVVKTDTLRKTPVVVLRRKITTYGFIH